MNFIYIGFLLTVLLFGLILSKKIKYYFSGTPYSVILQIFIYGIIINICILGYLLIVFKNIKPLPGPRGPMGEIGPVGFQGKSGECNECDEDGKKFNIGSNQNKSNKKIVITTPILSYNAIGKPL